MTDKPTSIAHPRRVSRLETQFELGRTLAVGGTSEVRVAYQPSHERCVVVKIATSPFGEKALANEARVTSKLDHPGTVPMIARGRDEQGRAALVMRLVIGRTWRQFIGPDGELSAPSSWTCDPLSWHLGVMCQVAEVLEHAHAVGIVHRDIKPSNVMIDQHGRVYLMDWGIAVAIDDRQPDLPRCADIKRFIGTTGHAAPEMIDTRRPLVGVCTDVYQLGTCLHVMLTGKPPHAASRSSDRLRSALRSAPASYDPRAPASLVAICHRAMARQPHDRFTSMAALREAVQAARLEARSDELARDGLLRLGDLRRQVAEGPADDGALDGLYAEGRRVFLQALRYAPDNPQALDGWQSLCEVMIAHARGRGRIERAEAVTDEMPGARPEEAVDTPAPTRYPMWGDRPAGGRAGAHHGPGPAPSEGLRGGLEQTPPRDPSAPQVPAHAG